jgi:hypothetical protein
VAVTEHTRYNLHKHFEGTMGQELAATLMEMLPGVGWGDVARKRDIDVIEQRLDMVEQRIVSLEAKMDAKFDAVRTHLDEMRSHVDHMFRTYLIAAITISCTIIGLVGAAARFL